MVFVFWGLQNNQLLFRSNFSLVEPVCMLVFFVKQIVADRFMLMDSKDLVYASDFSPLLSEA
jgi:hypothetical protein